MSSAYLESSYFEIDFGLIESFRVSALGNQSLWMPGNPEMLILTLSLPESLKFGISVFRNMN